MIRNEIDRLAMPVAIGRLSFFGPDPVAGDALACTVRVRRQDDRAVVADLVLGHGGRAWCRIEGWEDLRWDTDARLWPVVRFPEHNLLAEPRPGGWCWFADGYRAARTREQLARRFLGERERREYEARSPRTQRSWLSGRIAAKDAVRDLLWRNGHGPLFPVEIQIASDAQGRPVVSCGGADVRVSIAHRGDVAVALAAFAGDPGIDVETIEGRSDGFAAHAFTEDDLAGLGPGERDEWRTRLWTAKEAAGKARGTGLRGDPRRLRVTGRDGERLLVDGLWVETRREGRHVVAWTVATEERG
jgi:phosphopantetheinyl transferase